MIKSSDNKKYYWLKLKKDFFKRHDIQIIEAMPNGKDYILFYLKMLVESVDHDGYLRFNDTIPYDENMLATITNTNVDIVRSAMKAFVGLKMIEILEDKTIFMAEVEKMLGTETYWAAKKREQRIGQCPTNVQLMSNVSNQEIEKEIEKEIDINTSCQKNKFSDDSIPIILSKRLFNLMLKNNPNAKEPNWQTWARSIDLAIRVDKRTAEQLEKVIDWCQKDGFWHSNILSTSKLRDKFDRLVLDMNKKDRPTYQNQKPSQRNNFEQREYDDEYYDNFFTNTK